MSLSWRLTKDLRVPGLLDLYEQAWRRSGKSLHLWKLAYNEQNLEGWSTGGGTPFVPQNEILASRNGSWSPEAFDYTTLPLDFVTRGDFSMEVDVLAPPRSVGFAGIVFGMRGHMYRTPDLAETWEEVPTGTDQSLQGGTRLSDGSLAVVGLSGVVLTSRDGGRTFSVAIQPGRRGIAAVAEGADGKLLLFGEEGVTRRPWAR